MRRPISSLDFLYLNKLSNYETAAMFEELFSLDSCKDLSDAVKEHGFDIINTKFCQDGFDYIKNQVNTLSKL